MSKLKNLGLDLSAERFKRRDKQIADTFGHDATIPGRAVAEHCLPELTNYIKTFHPRGGPRAPLWDILVRVEPDRLAAAILSGAIHIAGQIGNDDRDATLRAAMEQIGTAIERECRSARLLRKKAEGYARLDWDVEQLHQAGAWGVDMLLRAVPGMFELVTVGRDNYLVLSAKAQDIPDEILWACVRNNPHHVPTLERPQPWTSDTRDGAWGERQRLVRCRPNSMRMNAVRKALARDPKPWLDALHKLESVSYRINEHMLRFVQQSYELATADNPRGLDFLFHENTIRAWRWDRETKKRRNVIIDNAGDRNNGGETAFRIDIKTAEKLLNRAFYVPMNFDTRGRVYPLPSFNFTRGDHIRCLFEFAEGKPISKAGLYWLKVHVANRAAGFKGCTPGSFTFDERVRWVDDHIDALTDIGRAALEMVLVDEALLSGVDDRFQFVRACIELYRANDNPDFESRLPLLFDATSSGLQHYCLLMRDEAGGRLVNLVPSLPPQDAYKTISEDMSLEQSDVDLKEVEQGLYAAYPQITQAQVVAGALGRKLTKGPTVTRFYGRKDEKHARQLLKDHKWMRNWAGKDQIDPVAEALIRSMNRVFPRPAQAMQFVQRIAMLLAKEHKSLHTGFPWQSCYHKPKTKRIHSWIGGRDVRTKITIGDLPELRRIKAKNSSAPNVVHGLDGTHVQLVALWARDAKTH